MASDGELDRNAILEKFASIKRMHDEVGKKQTEDYQKRLQKLKEEESNYMAKFLSQDVSGQGQPSARRDLFLSSKSDSEPQTQQHFPSYKSTTRTLYENNDHEWNIDDDIQPLNTTDNDLQDDRHRYANDDEIEENYLTAYHQLLQAHQQQQQLMTQQEQENMLSTIFEASCEEATPMTSLIDVHQQRPPLQGSPTPVNNHIRQQQEQEEEEEEDQANFQTIDDIPVSTAFSKNENLKYSEYILQKLQTEKENLSINQSQTIKEKRPFLRKRQGLAHYQAPPKRRQPKTTTTKRPTSADSNTTAAARPRTIKSKPTTKQPPPITNSNLLGKVDLDDEDDLLSKYKTNKIESHDDFTSSMKKFNSNIQSMIDTKWNTYKSSFQPQDEEEEEIVEEEVEEFFPLNRQRTSSQNSMKKTVHQPKQDLDEFEKLEQYAEEHPSMISTASYVEKVVLKEIKPSEIFDGNLSSNRIRQRKIMPLKPKPISDDEEEEEEDPWDDVAVAKVIPIAADEYNSDSGISSFKTQPKKDSARSSDFGDDQSWADRPLNSLMLNTFPGLRHTTAPPAPAPPPPPPPPSAPEPSQDYSRLVREKAKELEKQIELFEKENVKLQSLTQERNLAIKKLKQDRDEFEKDRQKQFEEFEQMKNDEMRKFRQEKRLFEQHQKQLREHPDKREREEIELLKKQITTLQDDFKQREIRWSTTINRLKERIETLEYENAEIKQEKDIIERKRLDLMHQLQTNNTKLQVQIQSQPQPVRKSVTEVKSNKTQSLPKTTVIRNSEPPPPPTSKTKPATTNGRRTPTSTIGVNGIKNNIDATRKINSLPIPKLSDEEQHISPRLIITTPSSLLNSDYPETFDDLDYKSLLTTKQESPRVNIPIAKSLTFKENLPIESTTNQEVRHDDGRIERIKPDQSKQIIFPNGSKQEISADGKHIRVQFYNGDYKEKHPDGRCTYKYASTNTTEIEYPDGTRICEFPNGQIEKHLPDGRQEHILPDKTKNIYLTDGTIISIKPNGEKFIQHPNQTKEIHTDTFKRKLFPNGSILTVFNTGQQEIRYANGKIKVKDAQGNIILEKKEAMK